MSDPNPLGDFYKFVANEHGNGTWVTLFRSVRRSDGVEDCGLYCALASEEATVASMNDPCWDVMVGGGRPHVLNIIPKWQRNYNLS